MRRNLNLIHVHVFVMQRKMVMRLRRKRNNRRSLCGNSQRATADQQEQPCNGFQTRFLSLRLRLGLRPAVLMIMITRSQTLTPPAY